MSQIHKTCIHSLKIWLPAHVLLLTSSAEGTSSAFCPSPSTIRSSSCEIPERDSPTEQVSDWNCKSKVQNRLVSMLVYITGESCMIYCTYSDFSLPFHIADPQMRFWPCLTASLLSRSRELPRQLEGNTKHLHFTPSRSHTQSVISIASRTSSQRGRGRGWGSEPYLIWPAPPLGGSPSLRPFRWRWPRDGPEEPGTAGYSDRQKPWIGSRKRERHDKRLKTTELRKRLTQHFAGLDNRTQSCKATKQKLGLLLRWPWLPFAIALWGLFLTILK